MIHVKVVWSVPLSHWLGAVWTFPLVGKEDAFIQEWQTQPETDLLCFLETAVYVHPLQARAKLWGL